MADVKKRLSQRSVYAALRFSNILRLNLYVSGWGWGKSRLKTVSVQLRLKLGLSLTIRSFSAWYLECNRFYALEYGYFARFRYTLVSFDKKLRMLGAFEIPKNKKHFGLKIETLKKF